MPLFFLCSNYQEAADIQRVDKYQQLKHLKEIQGFCSLFAVVAWSPSCVPNSATPRTTAHQAPLSCTISQSLFKFMSIDWWCNPAISSSVVPFSFCLQSFPALVSFPMRQFFVSGGRSIGASLATVKSHRAFFLTRTLCCIYFWLCWVFVAACSLSLLAEHGLPIVVASLAEEHRLWSHRVQ